MGERRKRERNFGYILRENRIMKPLWPKDGPSPKRWGPIQKDGGHWPLGPRLFPSLILVPCSPVVIICELHCFPVFTASHPNCGSTVHASGVALEGEILRFWCAITYRGKWAPHMTWTYRNGTRIPSRIFGTHGSVVHHEITIMVKETDLPIAISCLTNFNYGLDPAPMNNEATNVPDYEYSYEITVNCKYYK